MDVHLLVALHINCILASGNDLVSKADMSQCNIQHNNELNLKIFNTILHKTHCTKQLHTLNFIAASSMPTYLCFGFHTASNINKTKADGVITIEHETIRVHLLMMELK